LKKNKRPVPVAEVDILSALGLCDYCKHKEIISNTSIDSLSPMFKKVNCKKYNKPCYIARETIVSCRGFKLKAMNILTKLLKFLADCIRVKKAS